MTNQTIYLLSFGLTSAIIYYIIIKVSESISYIKAKRLHGCQEAPKYPHEDPFFGLDLLIKDTKEHSSGTYLAEVQRQYAVYGKTYEIRFLNARMIRTMDPKNSQAYEACRVCKTPAQLPSSTFSAARLSSYASADTLFAKRSPTFKGFSMSNN